MSAATKAIKVRRLVDVTVEADFSASLGWVRQRQGETEQEYVERRAKLLEAAVKDFEEFLRDHRSRDVVALHVNRVVQDQCSACGEEWETMEDGDATACANCGAIVEPTP